MGSGGGGVERATVVNVDGQAKSFLAASPENERQACQAGLTPSDGGCAWVPPSAAVAVTCRALRCPSKNGMRLRRLHQQYKSMPAARMGNPTRLGSSPRLDQVCAPWRKKKPALRVRAYTYLVPARQPVCSGSWICDLPAYR